MTKDEIADNLNKSAQLLSKEGQAENDELKLYMAAIYVSLALQIKLNATPNLRLIGEYCLQINEGVTKETREQHEKVIRSWGVPNTTIH